MPDMSIPEMATRSAVGFTLFGSGDTNVQGDLNTGISPWTLFFMGLLIAAGVIAYFFFWK